MEKNLPAFTDYINNIRENTSFQVFGLKILCVIFHNIEQLSDLDALKQETGSYVSAVIGGILMLKVPQPGKDHGYAVFVAGFYGYPVVDGASGLDDCLDPRGGCGFDHI